MQRHNGLALVVLVLLATSASAQQEASAPPARTRLGPVTLSPTLAIRDIGVDSNVFNQSTSAPDLVVRDFTFIVAPTIVATAGARRANVTLQSTTDFVYFARFTSERAVHEDLAVKARFAFRRVAPYVEGAYLNTRQRLNQEIHARSRRIERSGAAGVTVSLSRKLSTEVRAEITRLEFDSDAIFDGSSLAFQLNSETRNASARVSYALTPLTTVHFTAIAGAERFIFSRTRNADTRQALAGFDFRPQALISGSAELGYQVFQPRNPVLPRHEGLVGSGQLSYRLRRSTALGVLFGRNTIFSYSPGEPYYLRQGYGLSVRQQLPASWDVELGASRFSHRYRLLLDLRGTGTTLGHLERFSDVQATFGYDVGPRTRVTTRFAYTDVRSEVDTRAYDGFRIGASIFYTF